MNASNNDYWVRLQEAESDRKQKYTKIGKHGTKYSKVVRSSNEISNNIKCSKQKYKVANM